MDEQHQRFIRVPSLNIVKFDPIDSHVLVITKFWVEKTSRLCSWLHCEDSTAKLDKPNKEPEKDSRDGKEKTNADTNNPSIVHDQISTLLLLLGRIRITVPMIRGQMYRMYTNLCNSQATDNKLLGSQLNRLQ